MIMKKKWKNIFFFLKNENTILTSRTTTKQQKSSVKENWLFVKTLKKKIKLNWKKKLKKKIEKWTWIDQSQSTLFLSHHILSPHFLIMNRQRSSHFQRQWQRHKRQLQVSTTFTFIDFHSKKLDCFWKEKIPVEKKWSSFLELASIKCVH